MSCGLCIIVSETNIMSNMNDTTSVVPENRKEITVLSKYIQIDEKVYFERSSHEMEIKEIIKKNTTKLGCILKAHGLEREQGQQMQLSTQQDKQMGMGWTSDENGRRQVDQGGDNEEQKETLETSGEKLERRISRREWILGIDVHFIL